MFAPVVEADTEQEVRPVDVGGSVAEAVEHVVGAGRSEQAVAAPHPVERGARVVGEGLSRGVAGRDDGIVMRRLDPLCAENGLDLACEPGRVGDEHHPLAGRAQMAEAVKRLGIGRPPLVHHAPHVEDAAVVVGHQRGQTGQDGDAAGVVHGRPCPIRRRDLQSACRAVVSHPGVPMMALSRRGGLRGESMAGFALTAEQRASYAEDGFVVVPRIIPPETAVRLRERFEPMFRGEFETGLLPDEWNWRAGRDADDLTRQICNGWKADRTIAATVLSAEIGEACAVLSNWPGARLAQDNLLWKPPGGKSLGFHQDASYIDWVVPPEMTSCWIALDDTREEAGNGPLRQGARTSGGFLRNPTRSTRRTSRWRR